jgi:hypothetical protein
LPEIGQLLRHRRAMTTAIYAKVDHDALRTLARSWAGSCRMSTLRKALADYLAVRRVLGYKLARTEKLPMALCHDSIGTNPWRRPALGIAEESDYRKDIRTIGIVKRHL